MTTESPRDIVRAGYDRVADVYRSDGFESSTRVHGYWVPRFATGLADGARVLDLGCGNGVPCTAALATRLRVTGLDLSPAQIARARLAVPGATFVVGDMTEYPLEPESWDGVVALYSIIHVPLDEQPELLRRIGTALRPGGRLLAAIGHAAWTGTEHDWLGVPGATMYWSHADEATYQRWIAGAGLHVLERTFLPEGRGGHSIWLAERGD